MKLFTARFSASTSSLSAVFQNAPLFFFKLFNAAISAAGFFGS
jgi:hypothetical protein